MEDIYVFNIATCIVLGIVLLFTKSTHPHLQNYLIAKRVIALALFLVAAGVTINLFVGDVNDSKVEILNITTLIVSDLQIILLTFTLMTLYNSHFVSRKNIYTVLSPLIVLLLIYSITLIIYGDNAVYSHEEYYRNLTQEPALIIRTLIFTWGIISVIICINWFLKARQEFNKAIDNYFDGAKELHIKWVTAIFSVSLILLGLVIMSYIIILPYWDAFAITGITILFTINPSFGVNSMVFVSPYCISVIVSVIVPFVVLTSTIFAPIIGMPDSSTTVPDIFFFCCCNSFTNTSIALFAFSFIERII